ncbi:MAG: hypothetical protein NTZ53_09795 [Cyanobacteria bacterium]|nr:hypothetical protein [Cyanobacteriota bacterium]
MSPGPLEQPSPSDQPSPASQSTPAPASGPAPTADLAQAWAQQAPALAAARQELEQSLGQLAELEQLIVDLPGIFERKFAQRLQPLLERQRLLSDDNHALRERLQLALPPARERGGGADQGSVNPGSIHQGSTDPALADQAPAPQISALVPSAWGRRLQQAARSLLRRAP